VYSRSNIILFSDKRLAIISSPTLLIQPQDLVVPFRKDIPRIDLIDPHFKH
jgi:hypothetical protein